MWMTSSHRSVRRTCKQCTRCAKKRRCQWSQRKTVEPEKDDGQATIGFIGLELDSIAMEIRLPAEKLTRLKALLASWWGRKACRKRDLLSLIGHFTHAGRAVRLGYGGRQCHCEFQLGALDLAPRVRSSR